MTWIFIVEIAWKSKHLPLTTTQTQIQKYQVIHLKQKQNTKKTNTQNLYDA